MTTCKKCKSKILPKMVSAGKSTAYFCPFCGASQSRFGFKELYILFNAILLLWFAAFFNHHISAGSVTWSPMMQKLAFLVLGSIVSFIFTFYKVSKKQKGHWKLYNSLSFLVMVLSIALSASQVWGL
ncbi:hypothetical protein P4S68_02415 [Pseudoalteromonas sp. Hal099]|uniref:hypothetical protein n=1 Tax=Pseudoalteromonas sp. S2893 TaxID=579530 RepID=UPI00110A77FF|nr:hypothetical protein [Pseudoalteromonas sp. S2893]TMP17035.1 hypothetical protein CWC04_10010 [Pseudoalteromonas sp. S2893]